MSKTKFVVGYNEPCLNCSKKRKGIVKGRPDWVCYSVACKHFQAKPATANNNPDPDTIPPIESQPC